VDEYIKNYECVIDQSKVQKMRIIIGIGINKLTVKSKSARIGSETQIFFRKSLFFINVIVKNIKNI
jgi:hypothetical protein